MFFRNTAYVWHRAFLFGSGLEVRVLVSEKLRAFLKQTTYWAGESGERGSAFVRARGTVSVVSLSTRPWINSKTTWRASAAKGRPEDLYATFLPYARGPSKDYDVSK